LEEITEPSGLDRKAMNMELFVAIIGIIVALAAIVVSIVIARRYRDRRELSYETHPTPTLLSVDEAIREGIEIKYEGREVKDLAGITVMLRSTGNKAVRLPKDDAEYEEPITIYFGKGTEIIGTPRITETVPGDLNASLEIIDPATVKLNPILLNPGQSISIFTLLTNVQEEVIVNGHIEDTPPPKKFESEERSPISIVEAVGGGIIGLLVLAVSTGAGALVGRLVFGGAGTAPGAWLGFIAPFAVILGFLWYFLRFSRD
jgi:hypothetical protein